MPLSKLDIYYGWTLSEKPNNVCMAFSVDGDISNLHKRCSLAQFPWENCAHDHDETCLPMMPLKNIQLQMNEVALVLDMYHVGLL